MMLKSANPNPNPYDIYPSLILLMMICNLVDSNAAMNQKHDVFLYIMKELITAILKILNRIYRQYYLLGLFIIM